mgnify:FL=1
MPRVPLPVKLFLSYLCILLLGAGPTVFYISEVLPTDVLADAARQLGERTKRLGHQIGELSPAARLERLRAVGQISTDRISLMSPQGDVLFDSELAEGAMIENHASRPEVRQALGDSSVHRERFASDPILEGAGVSRRISTTRNVDTLYVAVRVANAQNETLGVLRLAMPTYRLETMSLGTVRFIRNATAVAVSAAIGFSLLAAIILVRPLQRVSSMVTALTAGDMGAKVLRLGNDEVGDLARALNQMATALRRKLLDAGLGEALIIQLVETLPCPCVVFAEAGDVVAINGPGRRALRIEGALAGQHMREFAEHALVQSAVAAAELEGEPEPLSVCLSDHFTVRGFLHVLKRPGTAPLRVFFGVEQPEQESTLLPAVNQIAARPLADVLELALRRCRRELEQSKLHLELPVPRPQLVVADADERIVSAVRKTLLACVQLHGGTPMVLRVGLLEEPTRIGLHFELELPEDTVTAVRPLIEPLGGSVDLSPLETWLWLPRG